jgi:hypothetical protein
VQGEAGKRDLHHVYPSGCIAPITEKVAAWLVGALGQSIGA